MDWLDIVKLALPSAICAGLLGIRNATAFLIIMVALTVYGLGFWFAIEEDHLALVTAFFKVTRNGSPVFVHMMAGGAAGIVFGWWVRTWIAMARSSRAAAEARQAA